MLSDVRFALRLFRRAPTFAVTAILTLALGIGANVAVFTLVDAVLFRPFPLNEPDRLVMLSESHRDTGQDHVGVLPGSFLDWRDRSRSFEGLSLFAISQFLVTNRDEPIRVTGATVSPSFFEVAGVSTWLGRTFPSAEAAGVYPSSDDREIVISHGLWQRWFGGDPAVLGQTLQVQESVSLTIAGVMPPDFDFPRGAQLWSRQPWLRSSGRGDRWRMAFGRLSEGASIESAARELEAISAQLASEFPDTNSGWTASVEPLQRALAGPVRPPLLAMLAAVALVFLIACANVATLVLQRGLARQRELAMRAALGASRTRLARQSLIEHALLAVAASAAGALLGSFLLDGLVALAPPAIPHLESVALDARALGYLGALAVATMLITGAVPALRSSRVRHTAMLRTGSGGSASLAGRGLVVLEVSLVVVLLVGAGLMARTMLNYQRLDLGFEPSDVVSAELSLPISRMMEGPLQVGARPAWDRLALFYGGLVEQVEALPGVRRAALVSAPTYAGRDAAWLARTGIVPPNPDGSPDWRPVRRRVITPGYFDVLRLPLIRGRTFDDRDHALEFLRSGKGRRRGVAIVNEMAARQFWPGQDPMGRTLTVEGDSRVDGRLVVGVAGDARDLAPDLDPEPTVYVPFAETPNFTATLVARGWDDHPPAGDIRARLRSADALLMIGATQPVTDVYAGALAPRRFITIVLTVFAAVGLAVAGVGLYGLIALSVAQRTREFGIRMALGATWDRLRGTILREVGVMIGIGAALGTVGALAAAGLLRSQLFGVGAMDAPTWIATTVILTLVGLVAAWRPARRAASVDPAITLRVE